MPTFTARQLVLLVLLTIVWGLNWPVLKVGVDHYPPLTFRMLGLWGGLAVIAAVVWWQKAPWTVPRSAWLRVALLALVNMVLWHCLLTLSAPLLSSGRAAILAYTMPIFSALLGSCLFRDQLAPRAWGGVAAAALGVMLLLWHEVSTMGGRPLGAALMLIAALCWALGTQLLRRTTVPVPLMTLCFWMALIACLVITPLSVVWEREQWRMPDHGTVLALLYNGPLAIGFAQVTWFYLARALPPIASTLSIMLIPVIGVFSGALLLGETLHWQDFTAVGLMVIAIASVLWPAKREGA